MLRCEPSLTGIVVAALVSLSIPILSPVASFPATTHARVGRKTTGALVVCFLARQTADLDYASSSYDKLGESDSGLPDARPQHKCVY